MLRPDVKVFFFKYTVNKTKVWCKALVRWHVNMYINPGWDVPYGVLVVEMVARSGPRGQGGPSPLRLLHRSCARQAPLRGLYWRASGRGRRRPSGTSLGWGRAGREDLAPTGPGRASSWLELERPFFEYICRNRTCVIARPLVCMVVALAG